MDVGSSLVLGDLISCEITLALHSPHGWYLLYVLGYLATLDKPPVFTFLPHWVVVTLDGST